MHVSLKVPQVLLRVSSFLKNSQKTLFYGIGGGLLLISILVAIGTHYWFHHPQKNQRAVVLIKKGATFSQIASILSQHHLIDFPFLFKGTLYTTGKWRRLKAGEYIVPPMVTPSQLIQILTSGKSILHPLTLIEGETSHQLIQKLLKDERFQGTLSLPPEGSLLPQTYHFLRNTNRDTIVQHMQQAMKTVLAEMWALCPPDHPLSSPEELLVVASLVEKETARSHERPIVAAVFLNRLREGMPLQADPTIVYALTEGKEKLGRALSRKDLQIESPYNTYRNRGLPPSPITNPSLASLKAVVQPAPVDYLYFVADGTGGHMFSKDLKEHQKNHAAWRKVRAKKNKNGSN